MQYINHLQVNTKATKKTPFLFLGVILLLLVGGLFVSNEEIFNEKIKCNQFDSNEIRIVCGGEPYLINDDERLPTKFNKLIENG